MRDGTCTKMRDPSGLAGREGQGSVHAPVRSLKKRPLRHGTLENVCQCHAHNSAGFHALCHSRSRHAGFEKQWPKATAAAAAPEVIER